jgi:hypothetical protein
MPEARATKLALRRLAQLRLVVTMAAKLAPSLVASLVAKTKNS